MFFLFFFVLGRAGNQLFVKYGGEHYGLPLRLRFCTRFARRMASEALQKELVVRTLEIVELRGLSGLKRLGGRGNGIILGISINIL